MYEHKELRPIHFRAFARRVGLHFAAALGLIVSSVALGMWGYSHYESLAWRDSFLNVAMLLGGMGPVNAPHTDGGKLFEAFFALYAGLVFIVVAGLLAAPLVHRLLHRFHWPDN